MNAGNILVIALPILMVMLVWILPRSVFQAFDLRVTRRDGDTAPVKEDVLRSSVRIDSLLKALEEKQNVETARETSGRTVEVVGHS